jgi:hypothetical protein
MEAFVTRAEATFWALKSDPKTQILAARRLASGDPAEVVYRPT